MTVAPDRTRLVDVCDATVLTADRGKAALVDGAPVALFRLWTGDLAAVDDTDPFSGAPVLSRGIVGEVDGRPTVASPLYKQRFDLLTGECLDRPDVRIRVHEAIDIGGRIHVSLDRARP